MPEAETEVVSVLPEVVPEKEPVELVPSSMYC